VLSELVAMLKSFERSFFLYIGEVGFHSNSVIEAIHSARKEKKGNRRKEVAISEPAPASDSRSEIRLR
jgi:hypothetical protein